MGKQTPGSGGVWNGYRDNGGAPGPDIKGNVDQTPQQYGATHSSGPVPSASQPLTAGQAQSMGSFGMNVPGGGGVPANAVGAHGSSGVAPGGPSQPPPGSADTGTSANDPMAAAKAMGYYNQQAINQSTTANRPDVNTPFGGQHWTHNPDGTWSMGVGFGGPLAGGVDQLTQQAAHNFGTPLDNGTGARNQAINAAYGQATSRLNPQWQQSDEQLGAQLAAQGLDPNSQAYRTAMQQQGFAKNDAYGSAMNSAIGQGTLAQQATFNENLQARDAPLNDLKNVYGLLPGTGFNSAATAQTPDYISAQNNNMQQQLLQQQIQAQEIAAGVQAGTSLVNAASSQSDERVKQNVIRHPFQVMPGVPAASFEYKAQPGQRYMGVIAQDLEQVAPQHVATGPDGIKRVSEPFRPFQVGPPTGFKPFGGG